MAYRKIQILLFILSFLTCHAAVSQSPADSLLGQLETHLSQEKMAEANWDLYHLRFETQFQKPITAIDYIRNASSLAMKYDNKFILGFSYNILGNFYFDLELYYQALDYQIKCYKLYMENGLQDSLGYVFIDIGNAYYAQGLNQLPDQFYRKSVQTFSRLDNLWGLAVAYNNIALVKQRINETDSAAYYFNRALYYRQQMNNPFLIAHSYNYLGKLYQIQKNFDEARQYLLRGDSIAEDALYHAHDKFERTNVLYIQADLRLSLATLSMATSEYEASLRYLQLALDNYTHKSKDINYVINIYMSRAEVHRRMTLWEQAETDALTALTLADSNERLEQKKNALLLLSAISDEQGKKDNALRYFRAYAEEVKHQAEIHPLEKMKDYRSLLTDYENNIRLKHIEETLESKDFQYNILLVGLTLLIFTLFILYRFYRLKNKSNQLLEEKNREVTEQYKELQDALTKVKTLSGLLPICASCKKIRDDQGYWHQIESYIASHSEADFSHSICSDCQQKLYPGLFKNGSKKG